MLASTDPSIRRLALEEAHDIAIKRFYLPTGLGFKKDEIERVYLSNKLKDVASTRRKNGYGKRISTWAEITSDAEKFNVRIKFEHELLKLTKIDCDAPLILDLQQRRPQPASLPLRTKG